MIEYRGTCGFLSLLIACFFALSACMRAGSYHQLQRAEEYTRQAKYDKAISCYQAHIRERLAKPDRPEWENPYFYLLAIGDVQLKQEKLAEALASYEKAEAEHIDASLISDRYRYVASLYERDGKLKEAIELLTRYRDRDPLLYDLVRDRIAKELTRQEDLAAHSGSAVAAAP